MEYLTGYTIKPYEITALGEVTFTDGTITELGANQVTCEAYGYTYDKTSGTCRAFRYNTNLNRDIGNINNSLNGTGNTTELGSNTIQINGTRNTARGFNNNCFINGSVNEIDNSINDSTVIGGKMGRALRQGEVVLGGGSFNIAAGLTQSSKIQLSNKTTDATVTKLRVQDISDAFITLQINSIVGYEIYITRLETGGTSGTAGDYSYRNQRGVVKTDRIGTISITTHSTKTIGKVGVNGTFSVVDSTVGSVPSITIEVNDRADVNNLWSATMYLHEVATNIDF